MTSRDILRGLGGLDPELVLKAAPGNPTKGLSKHPPARIRCRIACCASVVLIAGIVLSVGSERVSAAMRTFFSFIPGVGLQENTDQAIYTFVPITERVESGSAKAEIVRAYYADGRLSLMVAIDGLRVSEEIRLRINGVFCDMHTPDDPDYLLALSGDGTLLNASIESDPPADSDRFEVEIAGFAECLAFSMKPCKTYEDLCEVGPTVTKNGISLTATARRVENELVVFCYESRENGATEDDLVGIGMPSNGGYIRTRYMETENGYMEEITGSWGMITRSIWKPIGSEWPREATLHIPYLSMWHKDSGSVTLLLPSAYTTIGSDAAIQTDLGSIRLHSIERTPYQEDPTRDRLMIAVSYDDRFEDRCIYSFHYTIAGKPPCAIHIDHENGTTAYIEVIVERDTTRLDMSIDGVYYYLMEEYVIPLDMDLP